MLFYYLFALGNPPTEKPSSDFPTTAGWGACHKKQTPDSGCVGWCNVFAPSHFPWVQRVTPTRASVIGEPSGRTQAPLPTIGQIPALEKSRLALKLPHIRFVSVCRKHSADVHPHACRSTPLTPMPPAAELFGKRAERSTEEWTSGSIAESLRSQRKV